MKKFSGILFPLAVCGAVLYSIGAEARFAPSQVPDPGLSQDTVVYEPEAYKLQRRGDFERVAVNDSLLSGISDSLDYGAQEDTLPQVLARDTIRIPDSLQYTDPWRYKYYLAIMDSLTHVQTCDSLRIEADTAYAHADSLLAESILWDIHLIDSTYSAELEARKEAAFLAWYNSLSDKERRAYDRTQREKLKMHEADSLRAIKEEKQARKDSIIAATPRILDTYGLPKDMFYERIVAWKPDLDYHENRPYVPDTSFNHFFYDRRFQREDVNATWLGVDGSPVQYYDFFKRTQGGDNMFYSAFESWTYTPKTLVQYNTKSPYTELAYYGTLLSTGAKEQDNVRFLCTQNITPALNFSILYERFGGGGMLVNETVKNKTFAAALNHQGKRYVMNAGFISNNVEMGENGGIEDTRWVRDTIVDLREVPVLDANASSSTKKSTWFLDHRYSIPFDFIAEAVAKSDSTYVPEDYSVTTLFIGNELEYSNYTRYYTKASAVDSLEFKRMDAKAYLRLQPWSPDALLSKIDVGARTWSDTYLDMLEGGISKRHVSSSASAYAAAGGRYHSNFEWDAKAQLVFAGARKGDADLTARAGLRFYPFRKARKSPVSFEAKASVALSSPNHYQSRMYSHDETFRWDLQLEKIRQTLLEASLNVPYWNLSAKVGYAALSNNLYYEDPGIIKQNPDPMSVLSASLRKDFCIGGWLHLDNRLLYQHSTRQEVVPVPELTANLRYYAQFVVQKAEDGQSDIMVMQLGIDAFANTPWYAPGWNPVTGMFYNQTEETYTNGPWFDIFMNIQWKKACLFVKLQNVGMGWPMEENDFFSAHRRIITESGMPGLKIGITWPFYPDKPMKTIKL